jgi:hypothetical protein
MVMLVSPVGNVGGTSWKGQKRVFADEEHASSSAEAVPTGAHADTAKLCEGQSNSAESVLQKAQWKKIARQLLKEVRMNLVQMPVVSFRTAAFPGEQEKRTPLHSLPHVCA